jgi:ketosteroid isomerase-like protein
MATAERTDSQTTKQVLERFYAAVLNWDEDELATVVDEHAELHQPPTLPYGKVYRGRDELMELWKNVVLPLAEPSTAFVDNMIIDGEFAAVIAGAKMSGQDTLACEEYHVHDGRIVRIRMFWFDPTPVASAAIALTSASAGGDRPAGPGERRERT